MKVARVATLAGLVLAAAGCASSKATSSPDGGIASQPTASGQLEVKNLSFNGTVKNGSLTFILENGTTSTIESVTKLSMELANGHTLAFMIDCTDLNITWKPAPGSVTEVLKVTLALDPYAPTTSAAVTATGVLCAYGPALTTLPETALPDGDGDSTVVALDVTGIFTDAAKWTAHADAN